MKKTMSVVILCIISAVVLGCQSKGTNCEPTKVVFPTPNALEPWRDIFSPNVPISKECTFTGRVERGEVYKQRINQDLVLCLLPRASDAKHENGGWEIVIGNTLEDECGENFGPIVNPPYHANPLFQVFGMDFRNQDNTGKNDGSVNAPQEHRQFGFMLTEEDYKQAVTIYRCANWHDECPANQGADVNFEDLFKLPRSRGAFTITDIKLGNLIPNEIAWIEWMEFEVKLYLP